MSVGNNPITIYLDRAPTTLITGVNGSGKSGLLLDGISFGLFGKPHRKINKPQLINSINDKDCFVTVEFLIGSDEYIIHRGIKPNIFEIWKNGSMMNQDSKSRDYQAVLEQNILKLNHKSFHQIVVLGSSNFTPFMQLSKWNRREVIEDLLDITVFSKMNTLLKEQKKKTNDILFAIENEIQSLKKQAELQEKHIADLKTISSENTQRIKDEIEELIARKDNIQNVTLSKINDELSSFMKDELEQTSSDLKAKRKELYTMEGKVKGKLTKHKNDIVFFTSHDHCPTCKQDITSQLKSEMVELNTKNIDLMKEGLDKITKAIQKNEAQAAEVEESFSRFRSLVNNQQIYIRQSQDILDDIVKKQKHLEKTKESVDIAAALTSLENLNDGRTKKQSEKIEILDELEYQNVMEELLKDSGIKTKIIRQYLPVMNRLINEYLQIFDFFVSFKLDENFEESIRSRHRDEFTYASFSEGEKAKIDISLMLTWRQIAKMKNSTNTNLLVMDEVFQSALDIQSVQNLMNIFKSLSSETNIFVISHNPESVAEQFDRILKFEKVNNFTQLTEVEDSLK
jgi:DNA repair exonuclease SbcCD ATPase subunit